MNWPMFVMGVLLGLVLFRMSYHDPILVHGRALLKGFFVGTWETVCLLLARLLDKEQHTKIDYVLAHWTNESANACEKAAVETLIRLGYSYNGGELWKPPLGPVPVWLINGYESSKAMERDQLYSIFKDGQLAYDKKLNNPHPGGSLEGMVHSWGWVQRDLRVCLDREKAHNNAA